jgi:hypothetical protein
MSSTKIECEGRGREAIILPERGAVGGRLRTTVLEGEEVRGVDRTLL